MKHLIVWLCLKNPDGVAHSTESSTVEVSEDRGVDIVYCKYIYNIYPHIYPQYISTIHNILRTEKRKFGYQ